MAACYVQISSITGQAATSTDLSGSGLCRTNSFRVAPIPSLAQLRFGGSYFFETRCENHGSRLVCEVCILHRERVSKTN